MSQEFISSLEATLKLIILPDTATVKKATTKLSKEFYPNPDSLPAMIHILQHHPEDQIKQLAAIEARKLVLNHWENVDPQVKAQIRSSVLEFTLQTKNKQVAHNSARVVSTIGEQDLENDQWPDLLNILVAQASSTDVQTKETAVYIIYALLETFCEPLINHAADFLSLFAKSLNDADSLDVRVHSLLALSIVGNYLEEQGGEIDDNLAQQFRELITPMVNVLKAVIEAEDLPNARLLFNAFNDFAFYDAKLVGDNLLLLIKVFTEIALTKDLDDDYRLMALQFLVRVVPLRKSKIISKKMGPELTLAGLKIASGEVDEDEELNNEDEENENEESTPESLALRLLAELSNELPPSQVITPVFNQLQGLIESANPYERRAGLLSVGVIAAGAPDFITSYLPKLVPVLITGLKDSQPIVKVAALRTISELTGELQNTLAEYHQSLLPLIINITDSATNVMIYKYGTYALDGIIEYMDHDAIGQYLQPLMNKLFEMLQKLNSATLKTAVVSAIGSTAFAAGRAFIPYFDDSLKFLEPLIQMSESTEGLSETDIELKASTFENISTMARAVGAESFAKFAEPLINSAYTCINSDSARLRESGFTFIGNMAKVYGADFGAFLPKLIPAIVKCLNQDELKFNAEDLENEVAAEEAAAAAAADEADEAEGDDFGADDIDDKFGIHTGITMEKEIAAIALGELASATKNQFTQYVQEVVQVLLDQVENSFSIGTIALSTLWKIATALYQNNVNLEKFPVGAVSDSYVPEEILSIIKVVREKSIGMLVEEYDISTVHNILVNFNDALRDIGAIAIMDHGDSSLLEKLCVEVMKLFKGEHFCQAEDDKEEGEEIDSSEAEILLFDSSLEVLVALAITLGNDFNRIFASFKDIVYKSASSQSKNKRSITIGALAEIAGGLKENNQYAEELLTRFVDSLTNDSYLDVKSNAAFGIGTIIFNSPNDFSSAYPNILSSLSSLLNKAEVEQRRDIDDEETQDVISRSYANACGCVARLALKQTNAVPLDQIVPVLVSHLPLDSAYEENTPIFNLIIQLYQNNADVIEPFTGKLVEVFAEVFKKDQERQKLESESTLGREQNIDTLRQFQAGGLREQVVELLKYINGKHNGVVAQNAILAHVIAWVIWPIVSMDYIFSFLFSRSFLFLVHCFFFIVVLI